jgi:hypothetical protein
MLVLSTQKMVGYGGDWAAGVGMPLFTTALGSYGGVLCSGEL